ncbi:deoxyhypusine synthase [Methanobrevibacter sp.]|uniref:deoxyhypusine synthase n=1 Tax=Methanobrevibacter sp. TaxID=66852 RepID=UPI00388D3124
MKVNQINVDKDMKVLDLLNQFDKSGVLGAGRVARACNILADMIDDEDMSVFLSLGGPLIPGGMRNIVTKMINEGHIDLIVSSGANITHDLVEAFGGSHYRHEGKDDEQLNEEGIGRIADINVGSDDFAIFEKEIIEIFEKISKEHKIISIQQLLHEIGLLVDDENSFVATAARNDIPIFAPGLIDSMMGLQLWIFSQDHDFAVDAVGDMHYLSDIVFESEKVGAVLLGGGLTKHYTLASNVIKGGLDAAIQITMDRPEAGSLGGAPLEEAKSWAKARCGSNLASVVGDVTVIFPLIYAAALDKLEMIK